MLRSLIAALLLSLLPDSIGAGATAAAQAPSLVVLLASDQPVYQVGTAASFTIAVDNPTDAPVTVTFPSAQLYDVAVSDGTREVWRWSADRVFASVLKDRTFQPGVTLLGRESWDWRDSTGAPLASGSYRIVGNVATSPPRGGNVLLVELVPR
jgi:hypothetical protein